MNIQNLNNRTAIKSNHPSDISSPSPLASSNAKPKGDFASLLQDASSPLHESGLQEMLLSKPSTSGTDDGGLRETFNDFVGQTFFGQLIASMRSTQEESAYFNGGRAEKIFQGQLDQVLSEELSESSASQIADPMYRLFQANR